MLRERATERGNIYIGNSSCYTLELRGIRSMPLKHLSLFLMSKPFCLHGWHTNCFGTELVILVVARVTTYLWICKLSITIVYSRMTLGPSVPTSQSTVTRSGQVIGPLGSLLDNFDSQASVKHPSGKHSKPCVQKELEMITKCLQTEQVFNPYRRL